MLQGHMACPPGHLRNLLPGDACLKPGRIQQQEGRVWILATSASATACCPTCQRTSNLIHSLYWRAVRDMPWQEAPVELRVEIRRFRCRVRDCPRKTCLQRLPMVMARQARQTARLSETIRLIGYALGGEADWRLATPARHGDQSGHGAPSCQTRPLRYGCHLGRSSRCR